MIPFTKNLDNPKSVSILTKITSEFNPVVEITVKLIGISMIGKCSKCDKETEIHSTEIMISNMDLVHAKLCEKCKRFWYS